MPAVQERLRSDPSTRPSPPRRTSYEIALAPRGSGRVRRRRRRVAGLLGATVVVLVVVALGVVARTRAPVPPSATSGSIARSVPEREARFRVRPDEMAATLARLLAAAGRQDVVMGDSWSRSGASRTTQAGEVTLLRPGTGAVLVRVAVTRDRGDVEVVVTEHGPGPSGGRARALSGAELDLVSDADVWVR